MGYTKITDADGNVLGDSRGIPTYSQGDADASRDVTFWHLCHSAQVTVASTPYEAVPVDVNNASRVRLALQSNNNGTLKVMYTFDKSLWYSETVTGVADAVDNTKTNYSWTKDSPLVQVKYQYTETASPGSISGGFATTEKVGI